MEQYIGLDVSMKETAVSIRQGGKRIWRGKCASDPQLLAMLIRRRAPHVRWVVFETGPLSVWLYHALTAEGLPAICIDARHAKAALDMAPKKKSWRASSCDASGMDRYPTSGGGAEQATHRDGERGFALPPTHVRAGVGTVTVTAFAAAVEDPANFRNSRAVGAWVGLTTRRYQSGEVDYDGHISRRGDNQLRHLLFEAAAVILNRSTATSTLRTWALALKKRLGFKRAAVALARKLAVTMHTMLKTGELFDPRAGAITAG